MHLSFGRLITVGALTFESGYKDREIAGETIFVWCEMLTVEHLGLWALRYSFKECYLLVLDFLIIEIYTDRSIFTLYYTRYLNTS